MFLLQTLSVLLGAAISHCLVGSGFGDSWGFSEASVSLRKGTGLSAGFPGESTPCTCTCLLLPGEQQGALQLRAILRKAVIGTRD